MDTTNVQAEGPDPWAEIAAELRRIADDAEKLIGQPKPCMIAVSIQPYTPDQINRAQAKYRAATTSAVDAVAEALVGKAATTYPLSGGSFHHGERGMRGPIEVAVYQSVADPAALDPDDEIERLRARVAELEARDADGYSDLADRLAVDVKPVPDSVRGLAVDETGEFGVVHPATEGLVDETPVEPHPSWPTEAELKPWESLAPAGDRLVESVKPIDPDSSMEAHYDAEMDGYKLAPATHPDWAKHVYGCGGGRQCRCDA